MLLDNLPRNVAVVDQLWLPCERRDESACAEYRLASVFKLCVTARLALLASVPGVGSVPQIANVYAACHAGTDETLVFAMLHPGPDGCGKKLFDN